MMGVPYILLCATLLPLISFTVLIFLGKRFGKFSSAVATAAITGSLALSVVALLTGLTKSAGTTQHYVEAITFDWIPLGASSLQVGMLVDTLTLTMFVMVCIVATLVHIFSIGYMAGDPRFSRFFAYLGLFCFSMLGLVLSNSLLQLFICWELVGACSFLLIGFWFEKRGPARASLKAMLTNRIGDMGFILGMIILVMQMGPSCLTMFDAAGNPVLAEAVRHAFNVHGTDYLTTTIGPTFLGFNWLTWAGLCFFTGAVAKSAQFPLHVWLPDAMEGPTPVSALIHAATMVAAGVYLVARIFPILTVDARLVVAMVGTITLVMAAMTAVVQTDIKKVLAYSTISQLGYMILFLGTGGYVAGLFHLITHAFFKACLFLGAGSVIAGCHHEQEMTKMGGLWRKMPITAVTFLISVLAISGAPFTSGFFSKDLGLAGAFEYASALPQPWGMVFFWAPTATAYLTAFYMWRCWWLTFGGKPRDHHVYEHAKESPVMTLPLTILAVLAIVTGLKLGEGYREVVPVRELITMSMPGTPAAILAHTPDDHGHGFHAVHQYVWYAFIAGPVIAIGIYLTGFGLADRIRRIWGINLIYIWLKNRMYFDALYEGVLMMLVRLVAVLCGLFDKYIVDGLVNFAAFFTRGFTSFTGMFDQVVVDGAVNGVAELAQDSGRVTSATETGRLRVYVLCTLTIVALAGVVGTTVWLVK